VETKPALVYTWSLWQPMIGVEQVVDAGGLICFAAKWLGERKTEFRSDFHDSHKTMVSRLWTLLDDADAVLHFNGESFDIPHIQREFIEAHKQPPSPFKQIDLLKTVKKQGRFLSNKLAHVGPQIGLPGKVEHEGFPLWRKCMNGDSAAWGRMRKYNIRDVTLLEEAYEILRPWISSHPSHAAFGGEDVCPKCGSGDLERRGYAVLTTGRYARLHCKRCGAWSRETKRADKTGVVQIA
jgi:hypothetical protein